MKCERVVYVVAILIIALKIDLKCFGRRVKNWDTYLKTETYISCFKIQKIAETEVTIVIFCRFPCYENENPWKIWHNARLIFLVFMNVHFHSNKNKLFEGKFLIFESSMKNFSFVIKEHSSRLRVNVNNIISFLSCHAFLFISIFNVDVLRLLEGRKFFQNRFHFHPESCFILLI